MFWSNVSCSLLLCATTLLVANTSAGQDLVVSQNQVLTEDVAGNLIVTNGAKVTARRIRVGGNVFVENSASFYGEGLQIDGNLVAQFAQNVVLRKHFKKRPRVLGDVRISRSWGILRVFDARIDGRILFDENMPVDIVVRDSFFDGDVQVFRNSVDRLILFKGNIVWGSFQMHENGQEPNLVDNMIAGPIPNGSFFEIRARGGEGNEQFELLVDQRVVSTWITSKQFQSFSFKAVDTVTANQVRIRYGDDWPGPGRRLIVDHLTIDDAVFQTEDPDVYSTGTWLPVDGVSPGYRLSERLQVNGYFQYGLSNRQDQLTISKINEVLPDNWSYNLFDDGPDMRLSTIGPGGNTATRFRFGSGGMIAEIEDAATRRDLLTRRYNHVITDRVLQWTIWELGQNARYDVPSLPIYEDRYNITQAGTSDNFLHGASDVDLDAARGQLDVWSVADRQWKSELEPFVRGSINALTRTTALDGGALLIRRVIRIGKTTMNEQEVVIDRPYLEAWSPFSDRAFDSMALSIDAQGNPDRWFADSQDIPHYPHWPVAQTRGWAIVYDRGNLNSGTTLAIVFGRQTGQVHYADGTLSDPDRFVFNSMQLDRGIAVLPGYFPGRVPAGSIIDQSFILVPSNGIKAFTGTRLDRLSARLPAPQVYYPGAIRSGELSVIADRLENLNSQPQMRTDNLGLPVWP